MSISTVTPPRHLIGIRPARHTQVTSPLAPDSKRVHASTLTPMSKRVQISMVVFSSIALLISGYLTWIALTASKVAGCGGDLFDCSHVLNSRWAVVIGIPVGALAIATHAVLLSTLFALLGYALVP